MDKVASHIPDPPTYLPDMRIVLRTPYSVLLDTMAKEVIAEDHTGIFLLRSGSQPLLTALVPGVVVLRHGNGVTTHIDVSWGSLTATDNEIRIIVRHAVIRGVPVDLYDEAV